MLDIKVTASFILPGSVLRAETPEKKEKGEKEKRRKDDSLYRQETIRFKNDKPIVINLRKGVPATQTLHLSTESYKYLISQENPVSGMTPYMWKKLSNKNRIECHLKIIAHDLNGVLDTFTILED